MTFDLLLNPRKPTFSGKTRRVGLMSDYEDAEVLAERAIARAKQREALFRRWAKVKK